MNENNFDLIIENGVVTGYKGQSKIVEIPEGVTEIGEFAFQECDFIESIHSNSTVLKTIGMMAFEKCKNLKICKLKVLKGSIESNAFNGCENLKFFEVPNGTIKIGDSAFDCCKNLVYLVIPASVFIIEGYILEIGNKKTVILGELGSEAEEYANKKMIPFEENTQAIRNEFLQLANKSDNTGYKDFNIFGETVRCYKSVIVYKELLDFFNNLNNEFSNEVISYLPVEITKPNDKLGNLATLSNKYAEKTRTFLQKHGVFISDTMFAGKIIEFNANYFTVCQTFIETYGEIINATKSGAETLRSNLIAEAESKVTGLSYGVIGDSLTLFAHAIDECLAENRQRKEAYAVANTKMQEGRIAIVNKAQRIYSDFLNKTVLPAFDKSITYICEGLMQFAVEELIEGKVIAQEVFNIYDVSKSNKLVEQAKKNSNVDKKYAVAAALKLFPFNIDAIEYTIRNNLIEDELLNLIEYLELYKNDVIVLSFEDVFSYLELISFLDKYNNVCSEELKKKLKKSIDQKAKVFINDINNYYNPMRIDIDTWNSLIQNYTILYPESAKLYNITEEEVKGPNGRELLSKAIAVARNERIKEEAIKRQKIREQKLAEEKRIEEERKEQEERARLAKLQKQREKEKKKKNVKIILFLISLCIVFAIVLDNVVIPKMKFKDIVAISAGYYHTVGLKSNGTVVATGDNSDGQCAVDYWTDIVAISAAGYDYTVGLKSDGTVVATGGNSSVECNVDYWTDIVAISAGLNHTVGLKSDGTVVATGDNSSGECDVDYWTDIVAISTCSFHTVGLKSDSTVVATGDNSKGECNVDYWTDIVAISAGHDHTVGLKSNGTVVATGDNSDGQCDVDLWTDIVAISAGDEHTVGLKSDGTVVATGDNSDGQCFVDYWKDIVAISACSDHTVGLKSDGTVVATGDNSSGECNVGNRV